MTPEQWSRVKYIFNAALEQEPDRRGTFVADASAGDDSVRAEVERLLEAQPASADFIEHPAASALLSGRIISHYETAVVPTFRWDTLGEGYLANGMPDKSLEAYSKALSIRPDYGFSLLGRGLALAALGRYDEALEKTSPDFRVQAYLLSRVGRYREASDVLDNGRRETDDAEVNANALVTSAWLWVEQKQYQRAVQDVSAAEKVLNERGNHPLAVLADLIGGVAELRAGDMKSAAARLVPQESRYNGNDRVQSNWAAALEGEVALAQGQYDLAASKFSTAQTKAWRPLGRDDSTVFAASLPSRDGIARVEAARGRRHAAIEEYRRLTVVSPAYPSSAVLEPRHVLELARLLQHTGDKPGALAEYARFLKLWALADAGLPELNEAKNALMP